MKNANFKIRLVASLIDDFISLLLVAALYLSITSQANLEQAFIVAIIALVILFNPIFLLYSVLMTYYFGGTLGKLVTGLQVVSVDQKKLSFQRIFFRQAIGYSFSAIFFGLGFYAIAKDPNKQAWHDKTVGSFVVQKGNLLFTGVLLSVLLLVVSIFIFFRATQIFTQGPLPKQIQALAPPISKSQSDICKIINGSSFKSIRQYEPEPGLKGTIKGYWGIIFKNNSFQWNHSNLTGSGYYSCKDNILQLEVFKRLTTANYDVDRKVLIWEGVEYIKEN